ncbi:MAG: chitobiase/beta-hexosaminidase C-terminal domain-containing protein, partial [Alloprevotella sp.]|nr:chitobiase/beta-hexosaminidase C-terminal domain-containing protein [Alloprevotella sp.]
MKKLYQLRTFLLLAVFSLLAGTALAASETFDFSAQGYSNQQTVTSVSATNFTVAFDKGTNSNGQQYYNTGTGMRLYGGNIMTIASDKTITAIKFTFTQNDKDMTPDVGTYTKSSASWTGSATSVAFTVESGKGHNRLKAVTVTYEDATPGDTRAATTLTFNPASYTLEAGASAAAFTAPTPVVMDNTDHEIYPSDGELSYEINVTSGEASLVTIDASTGFVVIDETFAGAFTVTASYAGDNSYKPSTGSYTVTVNAVYDIAGFKALDDNASGILKFTNAKVLGVSGTQYIWVRDASGAILLYNSGLSYTAGQVLNGQAVAKKTTYKNQVETTGTIDGTNITATDGDAATPVDVTPSTAINYDSDLVKFSGVTVTAGVIDGDNNITIYDGRFSLGYNFVEGTAYDIVGIIGQYNTTVQVYPISVVEHVDEGEVAKPTFSPAAGEVAYETEVTVSAAEGCTLKYTTDGTDPATSETAVTTAANTATVTIYDATTIRAIAYDADSKASEEATAEYTIALRDLTAPVISVASGEVPAGTVVTVSYSDPEATLLVTTDGSDPAEFGGDSYDFDTNADLVDATTGTLTASYTINAATTLRAVVMDNTMGNMSDEVTATYTLGLEVPSFQFVDDMWQSAYTVVGNDIYYGDDNAIQVYVCGSTTNATWYTLDGSDPTTSETVKKITASTMNMRINFGMPGVAVNVTDGQTLRAATYDGTNFSQVVEWGYTARAGKYTIPAGTYTKVTSNADITDGANYILVYEMPEVEEATGNDAVVFTGELSDTKTKYGLITTTARATDGSINISNLSVTPVVINASTDATVGGYTMTVNGEYLAWTSGNSLAKQEDAYYWNIDVTATEASSIISSVASADRFLQYNTGSPRFACYTGSQKGIALYKE